ncbi:Methanogenesis regulatory histidine kinase FilI [uncultured archaeon]|nr:Methanogenesis regulatory histidine kinase FilI [uncultured archaeon]
MTDYLSRKEIISFRSALILAVCITLGSIATSVLMGSGELRTSINDATSVFVDLLAALGLLYAAQRSAIYGRHVRLAWTVLFLGAQIYTIGDIIWTVTEVGLHQSPFPSISDGLFLAFYPIIAIGILLLPKEPLSSDERIKILLDMGIVVIASAILISVLLIAPTIESNTGADAYTLALSVAYPAMDMLLLFALIELLFRRIKSIPVGPISLLVIGTTVMIGTDLTFFGQSLQKTYNSGGLLDTGWIVAYLLFGLAGVLQANSLNRESSSKDLELNYIQLTWPKYLPYIGAGAAYILLMWSYNHPLPVSFSYLSLGVGCIIGLILIRQIVASKENESLYNNSRRAEQEVRRLNEELKVARDELELKVKDRTAELEARNAEMERFVYTVSHELRTPLVSISGLLGLLKQDVEKGDLERMTTDYQMADYALSKMDQLLRETLELSRIGRIANPAENVPFGEMVKEALDLTTDKLKSRLIEVSVADEWPIVQVDRTRLVEVLVNLVENSMKYMGDQAHPKIEIGQRNDGGQTVFFVRDNGVGIDPSQHQKVFGLFYRLDPKSEGTGVGLTVVKRIIEVHGGRIWIESELGQGCTVCFTLPLANVG